MNAEPADAPLLQRRIQIGIRSVAERVKRTAVVDDLDSEGFVRQGQDDLYLVDPVLGSIVDDIQHHLLED